MLIQNYGLYWKEDDVFWGKGNNAGALQGVKSTNISAEPVDFRMQSGVYVLYSDYNMIYVGQAGNGNQKLFDRLKAHRRNNLAGRWNQFSWFGTRSVLKDGTLSVETAGSHSTHGEVLNHIEAILIHSSEPNLNRQGGRFGKRTHQFNQVRNDNLGPNLEEMIHDIWKGAGNS